MARDKEEKTHDDCNVFVIREANRRRKFQSADKLISKSVRFSSPLRQVDFDLRVDTLMAFKRANEGNC